MSILLGDNFSYSAQKPLDGRLKYDTLADMIAVADSTMYDGCLAYCVATDTTYQWKSTNEVDPTLRKWREFTSGGNIQLEELPEASADELNNIYMYMGDDDSTEGLVHAHFYQCVSDGGSPATYSWHDMGYQKIFIGDTETWENLSLNEKITYDEAHFDDDEGAIQSDVYSTTETKTNKVWIDGKPIYRKVYTITAPSEADTNTSIGDLPTGIETVTFSFFEVDISNTAPQYSYYPAPSPKMTGNEQEYMCYWLTMDTSKIRCRVGSKFVSEPIVGFIEYTKTTDG